MRKSETDAAPTAKRPRGVLYAVVAMAVAAVSSLIAALDLFGLRSWIIREQNKTNAKAVAKAGADAVTKAKKDHGSAADIAQAKAKAIASATHKLPSLSHSVTQQQTGAVIAALVVVLAMGFLMFSVYRGRYWSRWGVIAFWFLASFTGTLVGIGAVLNISSSSTPMAFRLPAFVAGIAMVAAVLLVNLKSCTDYFALSRPTPATGAPARRGLFAPRTPPGAGRAGARGSAGGRTGGWLAGGRSAAARTDDDATRSGAARTKSALTSNAASRGEAYVERQRSKKRAAANAESVSRGAELARSRAKASKSRRIDT
jgi:hypothetical protein